jgi:hypothetical protein
MNRNERDPAFVELCQDRVSVETGGIADIGPEA